MGDIEILVNEEDEPVQLVDIETGCRWGVTEEVSS